MKIMESQNVTPSKKYFGGTNPWVFTEKGLYMVATILKSKNVLNATFQNIETTTKFEFNLGFAKVSRSVKRVKK